MSGIEFGIELKKFRKRKGYTSSSLSELAGKGKAYVSQLERGAIKSPDYDSCYKLLEILSFPNNKIEDYLYSFGIVSDRRKEVELSNNVNNADKPLDEEYLRYHYPWLFNVESTISSLKRKNEYLFYVFNNLIENDFSRAEVLLNNISDLTKSKESFNFLFSLLQFNFFNITDEEKRLLINIINGCELDRDNIFDYEGEESE